MATDPAIELKKLPEKLKGNEHAIAYVQCRTNPKGLQPWGVETIEFEGRQIEILTGKVWGDTRCRFQDEDGEMCTAKMPIKFNSLATHVKNQHPSVEWHDPRVPKAKSIATHVKNQHPSVESTSTQQLTSQANKFFKATMDRHKSICLEESRALDPVMSGKTAAETAYMQKEQFNRQKKAEEAEAKAEKAKKAAERKERKNGKRKRLDQDSESGDETDSSILSPTPAPKPKKTAKKPAPKTAPKPPKEVYTFTQKFSDNALVKYAMSRKIQMWPMKTVKKGGAWKDSADLHIKHAMDMTTGGKICNSCKAQSPKARNCRPDENYRCALVRKYGDPILAMTAYQMTNRYFDSKKGDAEYWKFFTEHPSYKNGGAWAGWVEAEEGDEQDVDDELVEDVEKLLAADNDENVDSD